MTCSDIPKKTGISNAVAISPEQPQGGIDGVVGNRIDIALQTAGVVDVDEFG